MDGYRRKLLTNCGSMLISCDKVASVYCGQSPQFSVATSMRPQQQVLESSAYQGLESQRAESQPSMSIHHFHNSCNLKLLKSLLLRWHGLVNSWSHRLVSCHLVQQLQAFNNQQPLQQMPRLAQHLPRQPEQLLQQLPLPAQQQQAIAAPQPRHQKMEQAQQPVVHNDFGSGTNIVPQAAAHLLSAPMAELIICDRHQLCRTMGIRSQACCWHRGNCSTFSITIQEAGCCTGIPAAALW